LTRIDARRLSRAADVLAVAIERRQIPGAVAAVGVGADVVWQVALGEAEAAPYRRRPMALDTVFDLASLTKVTATLPLAMVLLQDGIIAAQDPVSRYLPEFQGEGKHLVTVAHLLTHTSGLRSLHGLWRSLSGRELAATALALPLASPPGSESYYGDMNFFLLGELLARALGRPLDVATRDLVFAPLGMSETGYLPGAHLRARAAATEVPPGETSPRVRTVHDENTLAMGGVAGHAGLFGTVGDLGRYLGAWVGSGPALFSPAMRARSLRPSTPAPKRRGWGWILQGDGMAVMGDLWPMSAAGHSGFTGTSMAFDPVSGLWAVLLTNRVHFGRAIDVGPLRALFHNAVAGAVE
jgi:CubicO group peptidase (beta-lactamase class C family)